MRLWSIHPKYLDVKGLVTLWREALLAQNVLLGNTKGYKNHPQLIRFKSYFDPISGIGFYLYEIFLESKRRNYNFNKDKIIKISHDVDKINVTTGQLKYEFNHLQNKLLTRNWKKYKEIDGIEDQNYEINSLFKVIDGEIEHWEIIK